MQLHLFSTPGEPFLQDVLNTARELLAEKNNPLVLYLPAAAVERHFIRETQAAFRGMARVIGIKIESASPSRFQEALAQADLLFIPGGNSFLMAHRLHVAGVVSDLRERILAGLPLVAFSAGTVLCGPDVLTSNDDNDCGCTNFDGLGVVPFNFNVHVPTGSGPEREERQARLQAFSRQHRRSVLALEDGAYVRVLDRQVDIVRGNAWWVEAGEMLRD
jgi:dipeptidase E